MRITDDRGQDTEDLEALRIYRRQHPEVIIHSPEETCSRMWEVSHPDRAAMAFDSLHGMLRSLWLTRVPTSD